MKTKPKVTKRDVPQRPITTTTPPAATPRLPEKERIAQVASQLLQHITNSGWVSEVALADWATEHEIPILDLHQAKRLLDRKKTITTRQGPDNRPGWEVIGASSIGKKYGRMTPPRRVRMCFGPLGPLGQLTVDGNEAATHIHMRDAQDNVVFAPAGFRAMLTKAYLQSGLAAADEEEAGTPRAAIARWYIKFLQCVPSGKSQMNAIRRPLNVKRQAVGEIFHERLPEGTTADWLISYPESHFTPDTVALLLGICQDVGFSPAGNGKSGGQAGMFQWVPVADQEGD